MSTFDKFKEWFNENDNKKRDFVWKKLFCPFFYLGFVATVTLGSIAGAKELNKEQDERFNAAFYAFWSVYIFTMISCGVMFYST